MFLRLDSLVRPALAPCYAEPFRVLEKDFDSSMFTVQLGRGMDFGLAKDAKE